MWKNIVEPARPQMTIWRMRIACWIPKATDTHSEHVILIAFLLQQWLHQRASMSRYAYIACLVSQQCTSPVFIRNVSHPVTMLDVRLLVRLCAYLRQKAAVCVWFELLHRWKFLACLSLSLCYASSAPFVKEINLLYHQHFLLHWLTVDLTEFVITRYSKFLHLHHFSWLKLLFWIICFRIFII